MTFQAIEHAHAALKDILRDSLLHGSDFSLSHILEKGMEVSFFRSGEHHKQVIIPKLDLDDNKTLDILKNLCAHGSMDRLHIICSHIAMPLDRTHAVTLAHHLLFSLRYDVFERLHDIGTFDSIKNSNGFMNLTFQSTLPNHETFDFFLRNSSPGGRYIFSPSSVLHEFTENHWDSVLLPHDIDIMIENLKHQAELNKKEKGTDYCESSIRSLIYAFKKCCMNNNFMAAHKIDSQHGQGKNFHLECYNYELINDLLRYSKYDAIRFVDRCKSFSWDAIDADVFIEITQTMSPEKIRFILFETSLFRQGARSELFEEVVAKLEVSESNKFITKQQLPVFYEFKSESEMIAKLNREIGDAPKRRSTI